MCTILAVESRLDQAAATGRSQVSQNATFVHVGYHPRSEFLVFWRFADFLAFSASSARFSITLAVSNSYTQQPADCRQRSLDFSAVIV